MSPQNGVEGQGRRLIHTGLCVSVGWHGSPDVGRMEGRVAVLLLHRWGGHRQGKGGGRGAGAGPRTGVSGSGCAFLQWAGLGSMGCSAPTVGRAAGVVRAGVFGHMWHPKLSSSQAPVTPLQRNQGGWWEGGESGHSPCCLTRGLGETWTRCRQDRCLCRPHPVGLGMLAPWWLWLRLQEDGVLFPCACFSGPPLPSGFSTVSLGPKLNVVLVPAHSSPTVHRQVTPLEGQL